MQSPALPPGYPGADLKARSAGRWALAIIAIATLARLGLAAVLPVGVDEAYSIGIARQFSPSYFDHPPLHLWLVGLWAKLWGSEDLLLLRLPFVALGALSSWLIYALGARLFGAAAGLWSTVIFNLAPVFGLAHGALIFPDGPLLAAALATALVVARLVLVPGTGWRLGWWALAGLMSGLALLSKYHGVLLVLGMLLFLLTTREGRRWLLTPGPWLAAAIAVACFVPVLVWNAQHDWASFAFQIGRGRVGGGGGVRPLGPIESLLSQAVYLLPWIAVPLGTFLVRGMLSGPANARRWLLVCLALLPILIFTGLTLAGRGLPHWQMPGWLFAVPLLGEALANAGRITRRIAAWVAVLTALALGALATVVTMQARWGSFDQQTLQLFGGSDPTDALLSWEAVRPELARRGLPADDRTFIGTFNWVRAGELNALFGTEIPVLCLCSDARHFDYLNPPEAYAGWTAILIGMPGHIDDDAALGEEFASLGPLEDISLSKAGRVAVPLRMRLGSGFKP
ncbi:glycosyltransferase family 39 protein [Devosia insulae]|uniref:glycosyltransferase family 39 protein n=1 Tax=Devosia insulae TaxID=408174 RepID=UPI000A0102FB|nr:glycosyltransferase family 39 protein [Devosia insulae]